MKAIVRVQPSPINPEFRDLAEKQGWIVIGPPHSMADVDAELSKRVTLSTDGIERKVQTASAGHHRGDPSLRAG